MKLRLHLRRVAGWLRLALFSCLEELSHVRKPPRGSEAFGKETTTPGTRWLWLYVTTIGELNAVEPLIEPVLSALGRPPLALLSNHAHYAPAFLRKYPEARVEVLDGSSRAVRELVRRCKPCMLVVAEIPCMLHDAPCRFSYATLRAAKAHQAPAVLVNGWLYGYAPPSRMDALELRLLGRDYVEAFDLMLVQTEGVRDRLLAAGAPPAAVEVTGNLKFDAMSAAAATARPGPLGRALASLAGAGPLIVVGSVSETTEQNLIIQAFAEVRARHPSAKMILAPRHPENLPRMQALQALLDSSGLGHAYRSRGSLDDALAQPLLILDTMGELRESYAAADLAYVGTDHNVLEPLVFDTPVFVSGTWEPTYPSYPVYRQMLDAGAVEHVHDLRELGPRWLHRLDARQGRVSPHMDLAELLAKAKGATQRNLDAMRRHGLLP